VKSKILSDVFKALFQLNDYPFAFTGENISLVVIMWVLLRGPTPIGLCLICMDPIPDIIVDFTNCSFSCNQKNLRPFQEFRGI